MHMLLAVNAALIIRSFRCPLVEALTGDGRRIQVLTPPDDAVPELERLGCVAEGMVEYPMFEQRSPKLSSNGNLGGLSPIGDLRYCRRSATVL